MSTSTSIAQQLERHAVLLMESTIPRDMTCEEWRRRRSGGPGARRPTRRRKWVGRRA